MQKQELSEGIILYTFEPDPGRHYGYNITALIDDNKAILIDTAYERHALQVFQDLQSSGIAIEKVILSHFHDDHIYGIKVLPKVPVLGSAHYKTTLDLWTEKEDHQYFTPTFLIEKNYEIVFGKHQLLLTPFPGHSICGLLININNEYMHIGDELIFSNTGKEILPSVDFNSSVKRHFDSLTKLKEYSHLPMIPRHGKVISGRDTIERDIRNRLAYLHTVLSNSRELTYE